MSPMLCVLFWISAGNLFPTWQVRANDHLPRVDNGKFVLIGEFAVISILPLGPALRANEFNLFHNASPTGIFFRPFSIDLAQILASPL